MPSCFNLPFSLASLFSSASLFLASPETMRDHIVSGGPDVGGVGGGADIFNLVTNFGLKADGSVMMRGGKKIRDPGK